MKLQILIPQYKETDEVVKPLLDSIAIQQNVDLKNEVGVIIANDGSDVLLSDELLGSYPFDVTYIMAPHQGVSATRNAFRMCADSGSFSGKSRMGASTVSYRSSWKKAGCRIQRK